MTHPETNEPLILQPGDEPDEALAEVITNPAAWEPDEDGDADDADPEEKPEPETKPDTETKARSRTRKQADE